MNGYFVRACERVQLICAKMALLLACMCLLSPAAAQAQVRKVALIIGNSQYQNTSALPNPRNDARLVAEAARQAGFDVTLADDLTNEKFQRTLREFRLGANGADIAMIYYAGHAIEGQGRNWLIPVDAKLQTEFDLPYETINLDRLLESVSGARTRMLILDSCRNNPFGNNWRSSVRATPAGLAGVNDIDDVLIIYAAAPGQVALDGNTGNSPFAKSLAKRLVQPGLPLQLLGGAIRDDVLAATGGKQRPFVSASMTGEPVYLVAKAGGTGITGTSSAADRTALEALAWQGASTSNSLTGYQTFLEQFPNGLFARMARDNVARIQARTSGGVSVAARTPVTNEPPQDRPIAGPPANLAAASSGGPAKTPVGPRPIDPDLAAGIAPSGTDAPKTQEPTQSFVVPGAGANPSMSASTLAMSELNRQRATARLPAMPLAPKFSDSGYPGCTHDYQKIGEVLAKVDAINKCTVALDQYYAGTMIGFRQKMMAHQDEISKLYTDKVGGNPVYTPTDQSSFFQAMRVEHAASNPDGANFADYRATEARYNADRKELQAKYCEFAGCDANGNPLLDANKVKKK